MLTSGAHATAMEGADVIAALVQRAAGRIGVMAGAALFLVAAALFGMFAWVGTRTPNRVARAAAPVAAALCATGTFLALGQEPARVAVLSAEALLFVYAGHIRRLAGVEWVGHTLFAALVIAFLGESYQARTIAFDLLSFTQLAMILQHREHAAGLPMHDDRQGDQRSGEMPPAAIAHCHVQPLGIPGGSGCQRRPDARAIGVEEAQQRPLLQLALRLAEQGRG